MKVPASTSSAHKRSYSACEPSHHNTRSGLASRAISDTHLRRPPWRTQVGVLDWSTGTGLGAFIASTPERQTAQRWAGPVRGRLLGADSSTRLPAAALPVDAGAAQKFLLYKKLDSREPASGCARCGRVNPGLARGPHLPMQKRA